MPLPTGKNASFSFGGTVYDADDCVSNWTLNDAINEVIYQCGGYDKGAAGTRSATFSVTLALAAADTTKVGALVPGGTGAFEAHPAGDTATYQEITATEALVTQATRSAPQNGVITMDLSIRLNDITLGTAT